MNRAMDPVIVHIDMDSFFVSVERLRNPALRGAVVAVGGPAGGRGVISSASYEARAFGVRSAMPVSEALRLCPKLILVQSSHGVYGEYSRRIEETLLTFSPLVEMASGDEAYVDLSGTEKLWGPPAAVANRMREAIVAATELPCSVGVATSKMVGKIASDICKPHGLLWVPAGAEAAFLKPLPINRMPGAGPKTTERLRELGLRTIGQLADMDPARLEKLFGTWGRELSERARGIYRSPVVPDSLPKSVSAEETFDRDQTAPDFLDATLSQLCERVAGRLRRYGAWAGSVTLKYRYADFETHTAQSSLPTGTNDELELLREARALLARHWRGRSIRLLGVAGANLLFDRVQLDLLESTDDGKRDRLAEAIDASRKKYGFGALRRGSSLKDEE